jgi:SPP1 family predicted phage head-tail adaptor
MGLGYPPLPWLPLCALWAATVQERPAGRLQGMPGERMHAGPLRHRVRLYRRILSRQGSGAMVNSYQEVATVWASIEPLRGDEFFAGQQVQGKTWTRIRIRYRPGITRTMQVQHTVEDGGSPELVRKYDVEALVDMDNRHQELHLMCVERDADGFRA